MAYNREDHGTVYGRSWSRWTKEKEESFIKVLRLNPKIRKAELAELFNVTPDAATGKRWRLKRANRI
jgi:hypothetical protein